MFKKISDNEIYLLIKYIKRFLWRVAKRLSYIEDAWCLKVKQYHTVIQSREQNLNNHCSDHLTSDKTAINLTNLHTLKCVRIVHVYN